MCRSGKPAISFHFENVNALKVCGACGCLIALPFAVNAALPLTCNVLPQLTSGAMAVMVQGNKDSSISAFLTSLLDSTVEALPAAHGSVAIANEPKMPIPAPLLALLSRPAGAKVLNSSEKNRRASEPQEREPETTYVIPVAIA